MPVARDVSIRVEFNPSVAAGYRLIGYEAHPLFEPLLPPASGGAGAFKALAAGRTVTALYEVVPAGRRMPDAGPPRARASR